MRLQIVTPPDASPSGFSLSPDGRKLVYSVQSSLWLRSLDSGQSELLPGTDGSAVNTFWPPDSLAFGFNTSDRLMRFDIGGNLARMLSKVPAGVGIRGVTWNGKGNLLAGSPGDHMPLYLLASSDGSASAATSIAADQTTQGYPCFLPDGNHFLFFARTATGQGIYVGSIDSKDTRRLFDSDTGPVFYPPDYVLFARRGSLLAQRLDMKEWKPVGEPVSVSSEVFVDMSVGSTSVRGIAAASASAVGSLAFRARGDRTQLAWVDREGNVVRKIAGTEQLAEMREDLRLSPNGRTVAVARTANGNRDVWLVDIESGTARRFTSHEGWEGHPTWSPDGKRLVFSGLKKGLLDLYQRSTSGAEPEERLLENSEGKAPQDWSPDGRYLLFQTSNPRTSDDLWVLPLDGRSSPARVIGTDALECCGRFSPDGRFIVYQSWETGRSEIYAQPFMREGPKQRISTDGGINAQWRNDGKELFYRAQDGRLMAVPVDPSGGFLKTGTPKPLFRVSTRAYLPSPDGTRFLTNIVIEPPPPITILLNWDPSAKK
jgi:Tol biopolymer transport system component